MARSGVSADDDSPAKWNADATAGSVKWTFPGRTAELYLMPETSLHQAAQNYADLTGHARVSPKWSFGYLQSRWGWEDKGYIENTLKKFHEDKLPVDAFIFDFECYTKTPDYELKPEGVAKFTDFNWNPALFPERRSKSRLIKARASALSPSANRASAIARRCR